MTISISILVLILLGCAGFAAALCQDVVPAFRWDMHIATRHIFIIRYDSFHQMCYLNRSRPICDPSEHPAHQLSFLDLTSGHVRTLLSIPMTVRPRAK